MRELRMKSSVMSKISVIMACSLASRDHKTDAISKLIYHEIQVFNDTDGACGRPCGDIERSIKSNLIVLIPVGLSVTFWLLASMPTILLRSKSRVQGIKSCVWGIFLLWVHMIIGYLWFKGGHRAQGYVWALHSTCQVLSLWGGSGSKGLTYPGLHKVITCLGVTSITSFAWYIGPPVGLAAWYNGSHAQCGWSVHLVAVIGVELVGWVLDVLGWLGGLWGV